MDLRGTHRHCSLALLGALLLACVGGCGSAVDQAAETTALAQRILGGQPPAGATEALRIHYSIKERPQRGRPVEVRFEYYPAEDADALQLGYTTSEGLTLNASDAAIQFDAVKANRKLVHTVSVTPQEEGLFTLTVFAVLDSQGQQIARSRAVSIGVGPLGLPRPEPFPEQP